MLQALAVEGRQADALRAFHDYRRTLGEQTGTDPSAAVQTIEQRIAAGDSDEQQHIIDRLRSLGFWPDESIGARLRGRNREMPCGVVTFLFTDIEGSSAFWAVDAEAMSASLRVHDQILRSAIEDYGGYVITTAGDSFAAAFDRASDAIAAAQHAQAGISEADWPGPSLSVRMGLHLGETEERDDNYFGPVVNLAARLEAAGHGGQTLLTEQVVQAADLEATQLTDLGRHKLKDIPTLVQVYQVGLNTFPAIRSVAERKSNLPTAPTRLIGRDLELGEIRDALAEFRLVTLTAAGGMGKTRLALEVGEAELPHRRDGVWFVDLTAATHAGQLPAAIANATGLSLSGGDPIEQVIEFLGRNETLLILDNCEHLVDGVADLLEAFLTQPSRTQILATTREYFDIAGEHPVRLKPLRVDDAASPAVELFSERARTANPSFELSDRDAAAVMELCSHLDGSPLAIELAAARSNVMTPRALLAGIGERFELLRGGRRRRSSRVLEDTLSWSYDLLDAEEQRLFRAVGCFSGSFDIGAIAAVAELPLQEAFDLAESLVAKCLLIAEQQEDKVRFRLLETTAAYAERLLEAAEEATRCRDRHLDHYLSRCGPFAAYLEPVLQSAILRPERENIRAAIAWAELAGRWDDVAALLVVAYDVLVDDVGAVLAALERCVHGRNNSDDEVNGALLLLIVMSAIQLDNFELAHKVSAEMRSFDDPLTKLQGILWAAWFQAASGEHEHAATHLAEARRLKDLHDHGQYSAMASRWVGAIEAHLHEYAERHREAAEAWRSVRTAQREEDAQSSMHYTSAVFGEAMARVFLGDFDEARAIMDEQEAYDSLLTSQWFSSNEVRLLTSLETGDPYSALPLIQEHALGTATGRLSREAGSSLLYLAWFEHVEGDNDRARRLLLATFGSGRTPIIGALMWALARRLDLVEELQSRRSPRIARSDMGRKQLEALRVEMNERCWLED